MKTRLPPSDERLRRVWQLVKSVPAGKVVTYGDIARALGPPCTPRQVGWALRKAPPRLRIPWHRVLGAQGRIALPGESGVTQRLKLQSEQVTFTGRRVRMELHHYGELRRSRKASS